jgi:excisionase family DNA binding protein
MSEVPARRWIRPKEAAALLGAHLQTIYAGLERGSLPGAKLPGLGWRLDRLELERRLERDVAARMKGGGR